MGTRSWGGGLLVAKDGVDKINGSWVCCVPKDYNSLSSYNVKTSQHPEI